jgi:hypothetical protein
MYNRAIEDPTGTSITIRAAGPEDVEALHRLAQRDSRPVPEGELLIALVDGEPRAAISLASGETIADPFHRTEELVGMLTLRGSRLRGESRQRRRGLTLSLLLSPASRGLFAHLTPEDEPKCATGKGTHSA